MAPDILQFILYAVLVVALAWPLGLYLAQVYEGGRTWLSPVLAPVERGFYAAAGIRPEAGQHWTRYALSVLAFSLASFLLLYAVLRLQDHLPFNPQGFGPLSPDLAFNTAVSFMTNTNWQAYGGETTMSYLSQMAGLTVQNFVSAGAGMAVCVAIIRGFLAREQKVLGNFWVDLTRSVLYVLLPLSILLTLFLVWQGVPQNFLATVDATTLEGAKQAIAQGPAASQIAIKQLGTNGGGFFNANSSHPFENPDGFTNLLEIFLLLVIPFSLPRTFGKMVGSVKQGYAILAAMAVIWFAGVVAVTIVEYAHPGTASQIAGGSMEGKEQRFGEGPSSLFAVSTTMTSTGSVNSFHDSYQGLSGGVLLLGMMLGEVAPGGVGSGLYGMLIMAVVAVFIAGLMVGRTPEYLGKKIGTREIKLAALYILVTPALALTGTALAMALGKGEASMTNTGAHGFSEVLYAYTSASNNNGSAFAGFAADTPYHNTMLGLCMALGRFLPMVFVLALAGSLAEQKPVPATAVTLRTEKPLFTVLLVVAVVIVAGLTFFPALALGPLAEGLAT